MQELIAIKLRIIGYCFWGEGFSLHLVKMKKQAKGLRPRAYLNGSEAKANNFFQPVYIKNVTLETPTPKIITLYYFRRLSIFRI
jgi:hypothetical protein